MNMFAPVYAALLLAVGGPATWSALSFRNIPPIRHEVANGNITLHVDKGAGGIVRALPANTQVRSITVRGRVEGRIISDPDALWEQEADDQYLRVGLIHAGGKPLGMFRRAAAPAWIRTLDDVLTSDGRGPSRIDNLMLAPHAAWVGRSRGNPAMDDIHERIVATPEQDGSFVITAEFDEPVDALGLWLMADGDDTASTFKVVITAIELDGP